MKETYYKTMMHLSDYNKRSLELETKFIPNLEKILDTSLKNYLNFEYTLDFKPYKD
jgi:hypothetical protein